MAMLKLKRLRLLLLISICFNTTFVVVQFLLHHRDKNLQSRIEIYHTLNGVLGRVGSRKLADKASFDIEQKMENDNIAVDDKNKDSVELQIDLVDHKDVNSRLLINPKQFALRRLKSPYSKKLRKVPENACPVGGRGIEGRIKVLIPLLAKTSNLLDHLSVRHGGSVEFGGWWKPKHCNPRASVAIMIPFRNREKQLKIFLRHMHPILQRQLLAYRIFVVEQVGKVKFNKGAIYNIGFKETSNIGDFDCYIFHDVDLLAENDKNFYGCVDTPRHMSPAIDTLNYKLPYPTIFGGVEAFLKEEFIDINGFSNIYWGWGGEDDDLYTRIAYKGMKLSRPTLEVGRYTMNHDDHYRSDKKNMENERMYRDPKKRLARIPTDGLNSLHTLNYSKDSAFSSSTRNLMYVNNGYGLDRDFHTRKHIKQVRFKGAWILEQVVTLALHGVYSLIQHEIGIVQTEDGLEKRMSNLDVGDKILAMSSAGDCIYSPVIMFLDAKAKEDVSDYVLIESENPHKAIQLTKKHVIFISKDGMQYDTVFAENVKPGDYIKVVEQNNKEFVAVKVDKVTSVAGKGAYAPLTKQGTVVVNGVVASCYAHTKDIRKAHLSFRPYRAMYDIAIKHLPIGKPQQGIHWYAKFLGAINSFFKILPTV